MSFVQLPDTIKRSVSTIRLNIPQDEKGRDLMDHLPYLAQKRDPIFQNKVEDLIKNREDLQAYLLATEYLNKTLDESLKLAVTHGKLNDAAKVRHISERNDPKYQFFKQNDNPLDVLYREHAKFDAQNPIIGSLLQQINKGRLTEKNVEGALKGAPNTKVLDLEDRWRDLFDRKKPGPLDNIIPPSDDDGDDDDDNDFGRRPFLQILLLMFFLLVCPWDMFLDLGLRTTSSLQTEDLGNIFSPMLQEQKEQILI